MNLYDALAAGFLRDPQQPWRTGPLGVATFADLDAAAGRVAGALRELGVRPGDRVVAHVDKSPAAIEAYLGTVRSGAVFVPLNPAYRAEEVGYFLGDAEPAVVLGRPDDAGWLASTAASVGVRHVLMLDGDGTGTWTDAVTAASPAPSAAVDDDDVAALVYTSGTTGRSKGAMLSHRNLISNARTLHALWGFVPGDVVIHALPTFHVHGLMVVTHTALLNGSPLRFFSRFDAAEVLAAFADATVFMGVPTMYVRLLAESGLSPEACAGMRLFVSGSAPLLPETFTAWQERTGHTILERYGMSETGMLTSNPYAGARKVGTVGPALPDVAVRIAGPDGVASVPGTIGDVEVQGPNVFAGYWRRPELNRQEFTGDGYFRTGDIGMLDDDGYLSLVGRSKDLVISGGFNVYPKEIELLLDDVPGVAESAVVGVPHPDLGEGVTALVVLQPGATLDEAAVIATLRAHLAGFKVPKAIRTVDELPRNAMGKVQKNVLRDAFRELYR